MTLYRPICNSGYKLHWGSVVQISRQLDVCCSDTAVQIIILVSTPKSIAAHKLWTKHICWKYLQKCKELVSILIVPLTSRSHIVFRFFTQIVEMSTLLFSIIVFLLCVFVPIFVDL